jgi:hypothetical protein
MTYIILNNTDISNSFILIKTSLDQSLAWCHNHVRRRKHGSLNKPFLELDIFENFGLHV